MSDIYDSTDQRPPPPPPPISIYILSLTSSAVMVGEVSSLDHKILDNTVETAALVAEPFLEEELP